MTFPMSRGLLPLLSPLLWRHWRFPVEMTFPMSRGLLRQRTEYLADVLVPGGNDLPDE